MSLEAGTADREKTFGLGNVPAWFWMGVGVYALLLINGGSLLNDSDTYWQIAVGQSILDHGALPRIDIYSFTMAGKPWISSSWLAQVLYAEVYNLAGWAGPVALCSASIAVTFAYLASILGRRMSASYAAVLALAALVLSMPHLLARPHVLALPVMLVWVNGLVSAADRAEAPQFRLLPLMALWANLHGGFVFGVALVAPFTFDALWNAPADRRRSLMLRWAAFGVGAVAASCITPYGWESILASRRILGLGELLNLISEWAPANFGSFSPLEACILATIAAALYGGVRLSPPRILLVLGLLYMALSHVRNIEIFALLLPLVLLTPVTSQFRFEAVGPLGRGFPTALAAALLAVVGLATWTFADSYNFSAPAAHSPVAAVDALKARGAKRVLNDISFGGYLISRDVPVFIDGRAELYGEKFGMAFFHAVQLHKVNLFLDLLKDYRIDAVMLTPATPAATLLDHVEGWQRIYSDQNAVVHVRTAN